MKRSTALMTFVIGAFWLSAPADAMYQDGMGLYEYVTSNPVAHMDPVGAKTSTTECYAVKIMSVSKCTAKVTKTQGECPNNEDMEKSACEAMKEEAKKKPENKTPVTCDCADGYTCCDKKDVKKEETRTESVHKEFDWGFKLGIPPWGSWPPKNPNNPMCKVDIDLTVTAKVEGWQGVCKKNP